MTKIPSVVHWFRLDLRLHDNLALRNAINEVCSFKTLKCYYFVIILIAYTFYLFTG